MRGLGDMNGSACRIIDEYCEALRKQGYSYALIRARRTRLEALGRPMDEVTAADVLASLDDGLAASSRRIYFNNLRYSFNDMLRMGLVSSDPTYGMKTPKPPRGVPRPFTPDQVERLLRIEGRARVWTVLGMFAGLRAGDVVKVEFAHLEERGYGWVLRLPHGKGRLDATIPAHDSVVAALAQYRDTDGPIWPILPDTMSTNWTAAAAAVGVAGRFHMCRHTYGTRLYQSTGDIAVTSRLMRHANIQTTMTYAQISGEQEFRAVSGL